MWCKLEGHYHVIIYRQQLHHFDVKTLQLLHLSWTLTVHASFRCLCVDSGVHTSNPGAARAFRRLAQ